MQESDEFGLASCRKTHILVLDMLQFDILPYANCSGDRLMTVDVSSHRVHANLLPRACAVWEVLQR
jgi:hypothetical protein